MSTILPSLHLGGVNGWKGKEGKALARKTDANGNVFPIFFDVTRNSGGSYVDANGLIQQEYRNNVPRITYSGGRACLMNEEARTNLIDFSEDTSNLTLQGVSNVSDADISPDGTLNADEIIEGDALSGSNHRVASVATLTLGVDYVMSVFVKRNVGTRDLALVCTPAGIRVYFDLSNGTVGDETAGTGIIEQYGDYYRCIAIGTAIESGINAVRYAMSNGTTIAAESYTGDGVSSLNMWGFGFEVGSYASSYIKTEGAAATRAAESIEGLNLGNFLGDSQGGLYVDALNFSTADGNYIDIQGPSDANRVVTFVNSGTYRFFVRKNSTAEVSIDSSAITANTFYKTFGAYKTNDSAFYLDGSLAGTDTNCDTDLSATPLEKLKLDVNPVQFRGLIHEIRVYDQRPSNSQLETETT